MFGGAFGIWQWIIILVIVLLLFARPGKISGMMGDMGKGLRNFRTGMKGDDEKDNGDDSGDDLIEEDSDLDAEQNIASKPAPRRKAAAKKARPAKKATAAKKAPRKASAAGSKTTRKKST